MTNLKQILDQFLKLLLNEYCDNNNDKKRNFPELFNFFPVQDEEMILV